MLLALDVILCFLSSGDEVSRISISADTSIDDIPVESNYKGLKLSFPLTIDSIHSLVTALKKKKVRIVYVKKIRMSTSLVLV